jgi:hypothetical protein
MMHHARHVVEHAKQAGFPHVLQAVKIHDLVCDENNNFIVPLKLPDMCEGDLSYPPDTDDKVWTEQEKCHWFMTELEKSKTYREGCCRYLSGFLYNVLGIVSTMGSFRERTTDGRSKLDASRR